MTADQIIKGNTILKKMHEFQRVVENKNEAPHKILNIQLNEDVSDCIWEEFEDFKKQADEAWKIFAQEQLDHLHKELEVL